MSGPMPAGSPSVSASGRVIWLFVLDECLAAQFLQELLRERLIALVEHFVAHLPPCRRIRAGRRRLAAHREHLDTLRRDIGRREAANGRIAEQVALLLS